MEEEKYIPNPQEKLAGALGSVLFFLPFFLGVKTEYVMNFMRQAFALNIAEFLLSFMGMILFFLSGIFEFIVFVIFLVSLFLAYQAFSGVRYTLPFVVEVSEKMIKTFGLNSFFSVQK